MQMKNFSCFESKDGKAKIFVETDTPIGLFHDFLMEMKGLMVERMQKAHAQQAEENERMKKLSDEEEQSNCEKPCSAE